MATRTKGPAPTRHTPAVDHTRSILGNADEACLPERIWQEASEVLGEVKVGPPVITINQGNTFMVTEENGDISASGELGVFAQDTRFISDYHLFVSGRPWDLLTSTAVNYYTSSYVFGIPEMPNGPQEMPHLGSSDHVVERRLIPRHSVALTLTRTIGDAVHDDYDLVNYHSEPVHLQLEFDVHSDFADLFEVKSHQIPIKLGITSDWQASDNGGDLTHRYQREDFERRIVFRLANADGQPRFGNGRVIFDITLQPGAQWHTCAYSMPYYNGKLHEPAYHCYGEFAALGETLDKLQASWRSSVTLCSASNRHIASAWTQSIKDMGALRLYDMDFAPDVWLPAAGVPWFVTIFGRDSLTVSLQNMVVHPPFAIGALKKLAQWQATEYDDWHDSEPGKILHELRFGEQAHFKEVPHTPYYGTADATILYLITMHEAWRWMGQREMLSEFRPALEASLTWMDHYGDLDGDGFQEYKSRSRLGYHNVGWKDAGDSVVYPDGSIVGLPIGLCELQGYVYDAKLRVAELMDEVYGEPARAVELRRQAADLKRRFNETFWLPETSFYAYALDPKKELVRTVASNPGHLLWSGIADDEKAEPVVRRLLRPDMFSGWGIRTLSSRNPAYNPFEYQRGSIWPHDNAFIATGFKRYGFAAEANQVAHAIFEAAARFRNYQLPELFAGLPRTHGSVPIQYPGANIPQAWAAGSIFQFVRAILGLRADAPHRTLYLNPTLPEWLPDIELLNLQVGDARLRLRFVRQGDETRWDVLSTEGGACEVKLDPERAPLKRAPR